MATPAAATTPVLVAALVIATCGLVYELLAGTIASWVLGDSVTQFSTVIGLYLAALGAGSYLSGRVTGNLARRFVQLEIAVALVGGLSAPALFLAFAHVRWFRATLYALVALCGTLVGLEIPLLLRLVEGAQGFRNAVARVLAYDHAGSLVGSLLFSLVLLPAAGPLRAGLLFGMLNAAVALASTWFLRDRVGPARGLRIAALVVLAALGATLAATGPLVRAVESGAYAVAPAGRRTRGRA